MSAGNGTKVPYVHDSIQLYHMKTMSVLYFRKLSECFQF